MSTFSRYDASVQLPSVYQVPELLVARLKAQVSDWNEYFDQVTANVLADTPSGDPTEWIHLTFRLPRLPAGQVDLGFTGFSPVEVVVELSDSAAANWDIHRLAGMRHQTVFSAVVGFSPSLDHGQVLLPMELDSPAGAPFFVSGRDSWISTAVYRLTVSP